MNDLTKLLEAFPEKNWSWYQLSLNPNITLDYVLSHPEMKWDLTALPMNPNVTYNDIVKNRHFFGENARYFAGNVNADPETILREGNDVWNLQYLCFNPNITFKFVKDHPEVEWNYDHLSFNKGIVWEDICSSPENRWDIYSVSCNPNITYEVVRDNPEYLWSYECLSLNPNFTPEILENERGSWFKGFNPHYTFKMLDVNERVNFSFNPNLTFETVVSHPEIDWNFYGMSTNLFALHPTYHMYHRKTLATTVHFLRFFSRSCKLLHFEALIKCTLKYLHNKKSHI